MFKAILSGSVRLCLSNFDNLIKAAGAWTVVLVVFGLAAQMAGLDRADSGTRMMSEKPVLYAIFVIGGIVLQAVAGSSIAVAWHRFALLGERPATVHLRFGRPEWRYFLYSLLLGAIIFAVMMVVGVVSYLLVGLVTGFSANGTGVPVIFLLVLAGLFLASPTFAKLGLMLPAAAIERPMGPSVAFRFGEGFGWPMVFATIVLVIPFLLLDFAIIWVVANVSAGLPQLFVTLQLVLLKGLEQIVVTILLLSVVTVAYAFARERKAAESEDPAA